ncbi:MAG: insulinase family protein [Nitrospiraceae bacterium]|uniref:M16 family metallopeptidase n=1 Tax=Nitrospira cf. moscoviensis SBR1015 TaxID=96242 RepID=UPI000A0BD4EC|nr:pitrilysin family protein [Nitrospira cf. moscoviensis SBR1015]MBY0247869.1 insulinase family protein [Nitrospiraceae bacterium]OQW37169.1 MAG: peptidase M16 [Nitrospira sp. SG-bin2]
MYRKRILDNGIRLVTEQIPTLKSVTVGMWVNAGSRDESPSQAGYSHFIEHMFFKGTATRSATDISREIDALGGEMNAFTTRETTTFYVKVLDQHLPKALNLLSDLFHRSRFGPKEIEKEKQVVLEEIRMVQDDPEDLVQELHTGLVMGRHPLSRPILGQETTIAKLRRDDLLDYVGTHYRPQEMVLAVAGNFDQRGLERTMARTFGRHRPSVSAAPRRRWPPDICGGVVTKRKSLEQVHLCVGLKGIPAGHKDRYAAYVLNSVLGGSVSSRLFQEIREKRGLAYSIYSFLSGYSDGGTMTVYAGTRAREVERVLDLIRREVRNMAAHGIERAELKRTKDQMKGSLMLSLESSHSRMNKLAKDELITGAHTSLEEMLSDIDAVTGQRVAQVAQELFAPGTMAITALGPLSSRQIAALQ